MTPAQIETMRAIQDGYLPDWSELPSWAWKHVEDDVALTEAGAEVLRLAEELAEAKRERLQVGLRAGFDVGALEEERDSLRADLKRALAALGLPDPIDPRKQTLLLHIDPAKMAVFEAAGFVPGSRGLEGWIVEQVAALGEAGKVLAAEQGRPEGAPSEGWVFTKHRFLGWCWALPYDDQELPAEYRGQPWSGLDTDHDPKCIVFANRLDGGWSLWWRLGRLPVSDHPTARAAMQAADSFLPPSGGRTELDSGVGDP